MPNGKAYSDQLILNVLRKEKKVEYKGKYTYVQALVGLTMNQMALH